MADPLVDRLKKMSTHEPMRPNTIRLPISLEEEMRQVCDSSGITFAVLMREVVELGWEEMKKNSASISKLLGEA